MSSELQDHMRPDHAGDEAVAASGKMSEALETLERARGHLYSFHQLIGEADLMLDAALEALRAADAPELADRIERELLGRNVLEGRWTFQVVEEFDDGYWSLFRELERAVRDALLDGRRHVYEAEMKERRRTHGEPGHSAAPGR
jgi:phosphate uptake regulator